MTTTSHSKALTVSLLDADCRQLAAQIAMTHARGTTATWAASDELLDAAKQLFTATADKRSESTPDLLAGIGRLLGHGPFPAVRLHAAHERSPIPLELRPTRPVGPPEEDVLLHALAYATPPGSRPWPLAHPDPARLAAAVRALTGAVSCRMAPLRAVALRYLLEQQHVVEDHSHRQLSRRAAWLLDPRVDDPATLLSRLTQPQDPLLTALDVTPRSARRMSSPATFAVADWERWEAAHGLVRLSGRIRTLRVHRHLTFADLQWSGRAAQLALRPDLAADLRGGDLVTVRGTCAPSRTGQRTVFVDEVEFHQPGVLEAGDDHAVSAVLGPVRRRLAEAGFAETISPVLSSGYFGGSSLPFTTWAAAAEQNQYLRVTTELDLLRALSAGVSRSYEIGPSFRNEGLRGRSSNEFLMLEAYSADLDLTGMTDFVVTLVRSTAGCTAPLRTVTFDAAFQALSGIDPGDVAGVRRLARELVPVTAARSDDPDLLARRLWRSSTRHRLRGLTLITAVPGPSSPLIAGTGRAAQRAWLYVDGTEIAEVSRNEGDPAVLARSFREQLDRDPHPVHRDYRSVISTFERGVPPCVGVGLSMTRLAQIARQHVPDIPVPGRRRTHAPAPNQ